jgi:hypothetical protein
MQSLTQLSTRVLSTVVRETGLAVDISTRGELGTQTSCWYRPVSLDITIVSINRYMLYLGLVAEYNIDDGEQMRLARKHGNCRAKCRARRLGGV